MSVFLKSFVSPDEIKEIIEKTKVCNNEKIDLLKKFYNVPFCGSGYFITVVVSKYWLPFVRLLFKLGVPKNNIDIYMKDVIRKRSGLKFAKEIKPKVKNLNLFQKRLLQNILSFEAYQSLGLKIKINPPR